MDISSEEKLIFLCSRIKVDSDKQEMVRSLLKVSIDWNRLISLARNHGITPLLYHNLSRLQTLNYTPKDSLRALKDSYLANLVRNITLWKELSEVLSLIRQVQMKVLLLRGIILSHTIYCNWALRKFADIDILLKKDDLSKLRIMLLDRGYREVKQRYTFLFTKLINPDIYSCLELHTMLVPARPYKIQIPQMWQRAQEEVVYGQKVNYLSKEDTFLSLALHIRRHSRHLHLRFICDITELLNLYKDTLDWQYIRDLARKNHIKNSIYFCLYISQELLDVSVSEELIDKFNLGLLRKRLIYLCMNKHNFLKPHPWQGYILRFLLFDRLFDILIYLWRIITKKRYRR